MGNGGYAINNKIYKDLGSPKLETFDDLYSYLKLVKEKHPEVVPFEVGISDKELISYMRECQKIERLVI